MKQIVRDCSAYYLLGYNSTLGAVGRQVPRDQGAGEAAGRAGARAQGLLGAHRGRCRAGARAAQAGAAAGSRRGARGVSTPTRSRRHPNLDRHRRAARTARRRSPSSGSRLPRLAGDAGRAAERSAGARVADGGWRRRRAVFPGTRAGRRARRRVAGRRVGRRRDTPCASRVVRRRRRARCSCGCRSKAPLGRARFRSPRHRRSRPHRRRRHRSERRAVPRRGPRARFSSSRRTRRPCRRRRANSAGPIACSCACRPTAPATPTLVGSHAQPGGADDVGYAGRRRPRPRGGRRDRRRAARRCSPRATT